MSGPRAPWAVTTIRTGFQSIGLFEFMSTRSLAVEKRGDPFKGDTHPGIRLKGKWLARAGFTPGQRVTVRQVAPGVLEIVAS